jgi:hypothetical protein
MRIRTKAWSDRLLWSLIFISFAMIGVGKDLSLPHPVTGFIVGQEWSIKSSQRSTVKIVIGRIEPWQDKIAVHVAILDIPNSRVGVGATVLTQIARIPFEKSVLAESVGDLIATAVTLPPDFDDGYRQWKEHRGGIFTISVAQAIVLAQNTLNQHN